MHTSYVDATDITISNWMRLVNCPDECWLENISAVPYDDDIYYVVKRDINVGEELLVW